MKLLGQLRIPIPAITVLVVAGLAVGLLAAPLAAEAQPVGKASRIGVLSGGSSTDRRHLIEAFRQGLRELGWVEGQNIAIEYRFAEGRLDRLPADSGGGIYTPAGMRVARASVRGSRACRLAEHPDGSQGPLPRSELGGWV